MSFLNAVYYDKKHQDINNIRPKVVETVVLKVVEVIQPQIVEVVKKVDLLENQIQQVIETNQEQIIRIDDVYDAFELLQGAVNYTCPIRHD